MSKYILSILDAMGSVVVCEPHAKKNNTVRYSVQIKNSNYESDGKSLHEDWEKIGSDFKKSTNRLMHCHGK